MSGFLGSGGVVKGIGRHQPSCNGLDHVGLVAGHGNADEGGQPAANSGHLALFDLTLHGPDQHPHRLVGDLLPIVIAQGQCLFDLVG
jgi:hypothetical protein